jgi:hypothetical protein
MASNYKVTPSVSRKKVDGVTVNFVIDQDDLKY